MNDRLLAVSVFVAAWGVFIALIAWAYRPLRGGGRGAPGTDPKRSPCEPYVVEGPLSQVAFLRRPRRGSGGYSWWQYFCPKCGGTLVGGPEGGASVNAVCKECRVNYGDLPGFYGDDVFAAEGSNVPPRPKKVHHCEIHGDA